MRNRPPATRVVYVHSPARADAEIFVDSVFDAIGLLVRLAARFLVLGSRAVVAAVRGD